jgi:hypothetical protein
MGFWEKFKEFDKMMSEPAIMIQVERRIEMSQEKKVQNDEILELMEENRILRQKVKLLMEKNIKLIE